MNLGHTKIKQMPVEFHDMTEWFINQHHCSTISDLSITSSMLGIREFEASYLTVRLFGARDQISWQRMTDLGQTPECLVSHCHQILLSNMAPNESGKCVLKI